MKGQQRLRKHAGKQDKMKFSTQNKTQSSVERDVFQNPHVS